MADFLTSVMVSFRLFVAFLCATLAAANSHSKPHAPTKWCTVKHNHDGADDTANILKAFKDCATDSIITFTATNYSAYTPITLAGLDNVIIHLDGNLLLPNNLTKVQHEINITTNQPSTYATPWFYFHGNNVELIGSADFEWGRFYGFGQHWWDLGVQTLRPQLATFNVTNGQIHSAGPSSPWLPLTTSHKVIKPVAWGWNLPGTNTRVENHYVDAKPDNGSRWDSVSFPFNTDGINISGQNITVDGYYGHNGDDCISVINGARNVFATNGFCGFSSHGLSIGSLGKGGSVQTVQGVVFKNWTMDGAVYGARFKSWTGGAGFADNVTWEDITLVNVSTAIFVTQKYSLGPPPNVTSNSSTQISNFKYNNFKGGLNVNWTCITPVCWNFVAGGDATQSIIFDLYPDTALNISVGTMKVHPFEKPANATTVICDPSTLALGEQSILGFNCTRGPYVATPIVG
ncbi:pectin lyase fold/virulence factor [Mycena metata]|uniref:galacturonan 1,4-alpha-galacturonidase n=1 Tax=Mycena metata TaxID=1033252 RepID=A0AAD7HCT6_9AGAR|nr:pectin lyase fold/virulence factor [Mycena metata]